MQSLFSWVTRTCSSVMCIVETFDVLYICNISEYCGPGQQPMLWFWQCRIKLSAKHMQPALSKCFDTVRHWQRLMHSILPFMLLYDCDFSVCKRSSCQTDIVTLAPHKLVNCGCRFGAANGVRRLTAMQPVKPASNCCHRWKSARIGLLQHKLRPSMLSMGQLKMETV